MPKICPNKVYLWFSLRTVKRLPTCMFGWQAGYRVERCRKAFNWFSLKNIERSQQFLRSEKMLQLRWPNITNNRVFAFDFIYWYNFAKQQNHFVLPISRSAAIAVLKASHIHSHHDGRSVLFCFAFFFTCFFWLFVFVLFVCVYAMPCYAVAHVYTCTHTHTCNICPSAAVNVHHSIYTDVSFLEPLSEPPYICLVVAASNHQFQHSIYNSRITIISIVRHTKLT